MWRNGPLDTLMIFTTTICVICIYNTNRVVMVPIIWLYITVVVVVVISFSVIVSCGFICLLLVTVGMTYSRIGMDIIIINSILLDGENISLDANLVMYINSTNIPPIMIINRMYENQNLLYIVLLMMHTIVVCIKNISPMARGCFIWVNINLVIFLVDISSFIMSGGILCKILVLGTSEMA
jgi:hypothetical protein